MIAKVPVVEPDGTVTVAGSVTVVWSSETATTKPAGGAAALIVTVPVIVPPPYAGLGKIDRPVKAMASIVSVAVAVLVPKVAVIVEVVFAPEVWLVATGNVAVVEPEATVTEAATVAGAVADNLTTTPPLGAAAARVTVPVVEKPALTVLGLRETADTVCADPKHGTSKASNKKRNLIGDLRIGRSFDIC